MWKSRLYPLTVSKNRRIVCMFVFVRQLVHIKQKRIDPFQSSVALMYALKTSENDNLLVTCSIINN